MPSWVILTGYIAGAVLRGIIVAVILVALVGRFFGERRSVLT